MCNCKKISTTFPSVEVVNIFTKDGIVKVLGTAVCVSGAVLMVFYRGPSLIGLGGTNSTDENVLAGTLSSSNASEWLTSPMLQNGMETWHLGVLCLIGNCFLMGAYLVIQVTLQYRLISIFFSCSFMNKNCENMDVTIVYIHD